MIKSKRILASGLGGGLDIINASIIYFLALNNGLQALLGSVRPAPQNRLKNSLKFSDSGSWINSKTQIDYGKGVGIARYCQPKVATQLGTDILFFSRKYEDKNDVKRLRQAILKAKKQNQIDCIFFVDGGGDSLTFTTSDAAGSSQNGSDPFAGGDSITLEALDGLDDCYLAVISVGLDISETGFHKNVNLLKQKNAYFGRVNMQTGQKQQYNLHKTLPLQKTNLQNYFTLCQKIVSINNQQEKAKSHTAVVTYHALKGNYGIHHTFVPWQPVGGVNVKPEHCWMYFFDASKIHRIKVEINQKKGEGKGREGVVCD